MKRLCEWVAGVITLLIGAMIEFVSGFWAHPGTLKVRFWMFAMRLFPHKGQKRKHIFYYTLSGKDLPFRCKMLPCKGSYPKKEA